MHSDRPTHNSDLFEQETIGANGTGHNLLLSLSRCSLWDRNQLVLFLGADLSVLGIDPVLQHNLVGLSGLLGCEGLGISMTISYIDVRG